MARGAPPGHRRPRVVALPQGRRGDRPGAQRAQRPPRSRPAGDVGARPAQRAERAGRPVHPPGRAVRPRAQRGRPPPDAGSVPRPAARRRARAQLPATPRPAGERPPTRGGLPCRRSRGPAPRCSARQDRAPRRRPRTAGGRRGPLGWGGRRGPLGWGGPRGPRGWGGPRGPRGWGGWRGRDGRPEWPVWRWRARRRRGDGQCARDGPPRDRPVPDGRAPGRSGSQAPLPCWPLPCWPLPCWPVPYPSVPPRRRSGREPAPPRHSARCPATGAGRRPAAAAGRGVGHRRAHPAAPLQGAARPWRECPECPHPPPPPARPRPGGRRRCLPTTSPQWSRPGPSRGRDHGCGGSPRWADRGAGSHHTSRSSVSLCRSSSSITLDVALGQPAPAPSRPVPPRPHRPRRRWRCGRAPPSPGAGCCAPRRGSPQPCAWRP